MNRNKIKHSAGARSAPAILALPLFFTFLVALGGVKICNAQSIPLYKNPNQPAALRIEDLLQRMTPEEKFWQLFMIHDEIKSGEEEKYKSGIFGLQFREDLGNREATQQMMAHDTLGSPLAYARKCNAIQRYLIERSRLGIPAIFFEEALHGLLQYNATVFPQSIAIASTFDTTVARQVFDAISTETKVYGIRQVLSPVINLASDVRWGRVEETYGEDPFLSAVMGNAFIQAFETKNIITTPKHFVANVGEGGRDSYPIHFSELYLMQTDFVPFQSAFEKAKARSVMTSYNSLDGAPCTANNWLLNKKLKGDWNFTGFVISDAGATGGANVLHYTARDYSDATAKAITNGLDVILQTHFDHYKLFSPPFLDGSIKQDIIDNAVRRVLRAKFELGLFEQPYIDTSEVIKYYHNARHIAAAKAAALKSMVLLKNENKALPLRKNLGTIAVIGSDAAELRMGGYSAVSMHGVSALDGISNKVGANTKIMYSKGVNRIYETYTVIDTKYFSGLTAEGKANGLRGMYFANPDLAGKPAFERMDGQINFHWTLYPPDPILPLDFYSVRWTGNLKVPVSAKLKIGLEGNDGFKLYINKKLVIDKWLKQSYSVVLEDYEFIKDKIYEIKIEFKETVGNAHIKLIWNYGVAENEDEKINAAIQAAMQADAVIVVAGIEEGEFRDRALLSLPGNQEEMIIKLAANGKPIVVVLSGGSAITMSSWIDKVDAVVMNWYNGEQTGNALADVLFGDYNPAGRLPITFPQHEGQLPLSYFHKPTGRGDDYYNLSGLPLFPFGFGLSYTSFEYSDLNFSKNETTTVDTTQVFFTVKNTGTKDGEEVVQLYIRDMLSSISQPVIALKGFMRVPLKAGESKKLSFNITPEMLSMIDDKIQRVIEPGEFRIMIGASSRDLKLKGNLMVR
ncbi:MAG: glycoside hydrolase family 3 C-terminal domain-containing protein [Bacteroidetes bacterium]|nr:glycoside hydrolase family 3 C-terminal domain-containing protein [Bacteroidota bacterium]